MHIGLQIRTLFSNMRVQAINNHVKRLMFMQQPQISKIFVWKKNFTINFFPKNEIVAFETKNSLLRNY